jgi:glycosyltransferase involved in cell wall biosynthesis
MSSSTLSIVAPVFNEESHVAEFVDRCLSAGRACQVSSFELILVNDGSRDRSGEIIEEKIQENPGVVRLVELSRNFGQQPAFHAGLSVASGSMVVTLDSDLQDPPELIPSLVQKLREGFDLVYARRVSPNDGSFGASGHMGLRSVGAFLYHRLMSRVKTNPLPRDVGEYRIMTRELVNNLLEFSECLIFLPGLVAYLGFSVGFVEYVRCRRRDRPRTSLVHLTTRVMDALTTFSIMPINLIVFIGLAAWMLPLALTGWILVNLLLGKLPTVVSMALLASLIAWCLTLSVLVIVAHYVGRIFLETKRRPRYFIKRSRDKVGA